MKYKKHNYTLSLSHTHSCMLAKVIYFVCMQLIMFPIIFPQAELCLLAELGSSEQVWWEQRGNSPALIWQQGNSRRVVIVIDNCVWVEYSVSGDNDSSNQASLGHSSIGDFVFPLLSGPSLHTQDAYHGLKLMCNYVVQTHNNLSSASPASSFYPETRRMDVIGNW